MSHPIPARKRNVFYATLRDVRDAAKRRQAEVGGDGTMPSQNPVTPPPAGAPAPAPAPAPAIPEPQTGPGPAAAAPRRPRRFGGGHGYPPYRCKVDDLLTDEDRRDVDAYLRSPGATVNGLLAILNGRGYDVGKEAVRRYTQMWRDRVAATRASAQLAHEFALLARGSGVTVSDGIIGCMQQNLMQFLYQRSRDGAVTAKDLSDLSRAVAGALDAGERVSAAPSPDPAPQDNHTTPGGEGLTIVRRVREILGLPPPPEDGPPPESTVIDPPPGDPPHPLSPVRGGEGRGEGHLW